MMESIDEILKRKKPQLSSVTICLDPELVARRVQLVADIERAKADQSWASNLAQLKTSLDDLDSQIAEASQTFIFSSIGRKAYTRLLDEFGPRKDHRVDNTIGFHAEEFPPALIAASALEPMISPEQAKRIWDEWSDAETTKLFQAALRANKETLDVPLSKNGSATSTRTPEQAGSTPSTKESPTASS